MPKGENLNKTKKALYSLFMLMKDNSISIDLTTQKDTFGFKQVFHRGRSFGFEIREEGDFYLSKNALLKLMDLSIFTPIKTKEESTLLRVDRYTYNLLLVLSTIEQKMERQTELWVAIDGYAGAGKTTLANQLGLVLNAQVFHTDDFFKKPMMDVNKPLSQYGSNIDYEKIKETIFKPVGLKQPIQYQPFDFKTHKHSSTIEIPYHPIHIFEGAFVLHPYMRQTYDLKVFYHKSLLKQYKDIFKRNGIKRFWKFMTKWIPNERRYVKDLGVIHQCDLILHNNRTF
jgi:uridine kinase